MLHSTGPMISAATILQSKAEHQHVPHTSVLAYADSMGAAEGA